MTRDVAGEVIQEDEERLDAETAARRRTAFAQIRQYGDPALRLPAREVEAFDDDLRRLVERMKGIMADANGVGLAANQIGVVRRVLVFQPDREEGTVHAVVNPSIVESSREKETDDEGCLSLQGVLVPVERSVSVVVQGRDETGADVRLELSDHGARVAQHEIDHLDGVLMLDRTTPEARSEALGVLRPRTILA